jgi:hypothetical protein
MRKTFLSAFFTTIVFSSLLFSPAAAQTPPSPLQFSSSSQLLWGDDLLGESQVIAAQYLRFSFTPGGGNFVLTGYGRAWKDFSGDSIRDNDLLGRLYYLYVDYKASQNISTRLGRQFMVFTAGTSIMDGARVDVHNLGPVGITAAGGRQVLFSLDSERSRNGNYFVGIDVHLENVKATQLGISYVRKYDASDLAREELGMNFRYFFRNLSPYAEIRYDTISEVFDEATVGIDVFPLANLRVKAEFYHTYPTFDATDIYSVFAVDKYREYLLRAEYSLKVPVTVFASYTRQVYDEADDANVFTVGASTTPMKDLSVTASVNYRDGYSGFNGFTLQSNGKLYGFEVYADYRVRKELFLAGGIQYDTYKRPELDGNNDATRYWIGGRWIASKKVSVNARMELDANPNFDHRTLGRVTLDWNL